MNFLREIVKKKEEGIRRAEERVRKHTGQRIQCVRKVDLKRRQGRNIIAEIKRRSPSKGVLRSDIVAGELAREYAEAGAKAISVLTEEEFFGGTLEDLESVSPVTGEVPVLRKDFILDEVQVEESYLYGADMVLLIARVLGKAKLEVLIRKCREKGLLPFVEVHTRDELEFALGCGISIVGVNNRDLESFRVDLTISRDLLPLIPDECTRVVESGIRHPSVMRELEDLGADAFLVGEALVTSPCPGEKLRELILN